LGLKYTGELLEDSFKGTFSQGGLILPLELSREAIEKQALNRPQEPKEPFPYHSEEVKFENSGASIELAGTLTLPEETGQHPVVVLISGSGPQDRNEELAGHKPFLVLSDYLTRNDIGVLRFDDRGAGESTGDFDSATSIDFASDVQSAVAYLQTRTDIDGKNIGLVGHSEGGIIAPMAAAENDDIAFIVLMAGTGIPGDELFALQGKLILKAAGKSDAEVERSAAVRQKMIDMTMASKEIPSLRKDLTEYLEVESEKTEALPLFPEGANPEIYIKSYVDFMATPWMVYFLRYDPAVILEEVECPVLAINGGIDLQVPAKENLSAIGDALKQAGNKNVTLKEMPGLNHLFQESETGSPSEYGMIEETFSPRALKVISDWIKLQIE